MGNAEYMGNFKRKQKQRNQIYKRSKYSKKNIMIFVQHRQVPVSPLESLFLFHPALLSMASRQVHNDEINKHGTCSAKVLHQSKSLRVVDNDEKVLFIMDIPGVKEKDVNVTLQGTKLKVVAERKGDDNVVVSLNAQEFELDHQTADTQHVQAILVNGVLTVTVPKKEMKEIAQAYSSFEVKVESADAPVEDDENDESIRLTFDFPGVKGADMKVSITDEKLVLDAERKKSEGAPVKFHRTMVLDNRVVDTGRVQAFLWDGVLTLILARKKAEPIQTIPVSTVENVVDENKDKISS